MPVPWLADASTPLPPAERALPADHLLAGLVAAGGGLSIRRLEEAYRGGIFPWYSEDQPILWWSPDPRMMLEPSAFKISRSFRKVLRRFAADPGCAVRFDADCPGVIESCARTARPGQRGTWIVPEMVHAYAQWHRAGAVHSVETWIGGERVGGLYGVLIGRIFFGESMFSHRPEASKIALAALVGWCRDSGVEWIDCQQVTSHLASLGAHPVPRAEFLCRVRHATALPTPAEWADHDRIWASLGLHGTPAEDTAP